MKVIESFKDIVGHIGFDLGISSIEVIERIHDACDRNRIFYVRIKESFSESKRTHLSPELLEWQENRMIRLGLMKQQ
jgi:hypothetical protein